MGVWHVCTFDPENMRYHYGLIGVDRQPISKIWRYNEMYRQIASAWDDWKRKGIVNYGFVIRIGNSQAIFKSTLLNKIDRLVYSNKYGGDLLCRRKLRDKCADHRFLVLRACLVTQNQTDFRELFSCYNELMGNILRNIGIVASKISDKYMAESDFSKKKWRKSNIKSWGDLAENESEERTLDDTLDEMTGTKDWSDIVECAWRDDLAESLYNKLGKTLTKSNMRRGDCYHVIIGLITDIAYIGDFEAYMTEICGN